MKQVIIKGKPGEIRRRTVTKTVAKLAHDYKTEVTAPTCEEKGYTTYECSVCKDTYKADYTDAKGHTPKTLSETVAATCTKDGKTELKVCADCNKVLVKSVAIPAIGHKYELVSETPATCTEKGVKTFKCARCGDTYTEETALASHNESNGKCTVCGKICGFRCGFCAKYEQGKDVPVIGWFISFIHMIIHASQQIAPRT